MKVTQPLRAALVLVVTLVGFALYAAPARAATVTVTLGIQGPSPNPASLNAGDTVTFHNADGLSHTIKATSGWTFSQVIAPGGSASHTFPSGGTFGYTDAHGLVQQRVDVGTLVVHAAPPTPKPTVKPGPTAKPSAMPRPTAVASPTATPTPGGGTGTAVGPGIGSAVVPAPTPGQSGGPEPNIAPGQVGSTPTPTSAAPAYSIRGLVQGSPHRYGLPAALALVAITGVASLLLRLLLNQTPPRPRPES